jgi:hypothetical protein
MAVGRHDPLLVRLSGGRALVAGGVNASGRCTRSAEVFHSKTGRWTKTAAMHDARSGAQAVRLANGRVLVTGGDDCVSKVLRSSEIYDPVAQAWHGTAPTHRTHPGGTLVRLPRGRAMVVGGQRTAEIYHPKSRTWTRTNAIIELGGASPGYGAISLRNGDVLMAGGSGLGGMRDDAVRYDVSAGAWLPAGQISMARQTTLFRLPHGRVLAIAGLGNARSTARVDMYVPGTNSWHQVASLPQARSFMQVTSVRGSPLVIGGVGYNYRARNTVYRYLPKAGGWTLDASLPGPLTRFGAVDLRDGTTLVVGGTTKGPGWGQPIPALARVLRYYPAR